MADTPVYIERVSCRRTLALFLALSLAFLLLFVDRVNNGDIDIWTIVFACLCAIFLFYVMNYGTLVICLSEQALQLKFGIFTWTVPLKNIEACSPDRTSLWRIGGAGIHFTPLGGRYRAMFNFLEHPRLVISLKVKQGLVRDIAFSTQHPDKLMRLIQEGASRRDA